MRNIKFRVWDGTKMYFPCDPRYDSSIVFNEWGWEVFSHFTGKPETLVASFENSEARLMQFTGLKDKTDKDIYEGDIVKINLPMGGFWAVTTEKTGQVKYESDYGGFIIEWEYSKNQHHKNLDCDLAFTSEVIGNIYENKNLLNN